MKRILGAVICVVCIFVMISCQKESDTSIHPCSQIDTRWRSEDESITLVVHSDRVRSGKMSVADGQTIWFYLYTDGAADMWLCSSKTSDMHWITGEYIYEYWQCSCVSEREFVATVVDTTYFTEGQEIVFHRINPA